MKKSTKLAACAVLLSMTIMTANAVDMSKMKGAVGNATAGVKAQAAANSNAANKAVMQKQIKGMIAKSNQITNTFNTAVASASSVLLSKEQIAALQAKKAELQKKAKTGETGAVEAKIIKEASTMLAANSQNEELSKQVKTLSAEKKQLLADCGFNVLLATTQFTELATQATELITSITNDPATAISMGDDMKQLKKVASNLPKQGKSAGQVATTLVKTLAAGGITVPKATSTSKAKAVSSSSLPF